MPALFTASALVVRLRPRSSLKIDYQSRLYEGDANLGEASVHYAEIQDVINNQRERIGWRAQFDMLRIERGQLATDFFAYRSARAQADALARAEHYRTNAKELNNTITRRRTILLSRSQPPMNPWRVPQATYSATRTGPVSYTNAVHRVPTSKLTNSIIPEGNGYTARSRVLPWPSLRRCPSRRSCFQASCLSRPSPRMTSYTPSLTESPEPLTYPGFPIQRGWR